MHAQKVIERLGYTRNEARVYLATLRLGEAHISDIATKLRLPRSSAQLSVNKLHEDGLVNFYVRKRYRYWVAETPERLLSRLREQEDDIKALMPRLAAMRHGKSGTKPHVTVFEGVDEIKSIYNDIIETKQHLFAILPWDDWIRLLGAGFMEDFIQRRVRHFLRARLLTPRTERTMLLHGRDASELRQMRFLPASFHINTTTFIYGTKVAIISLNRRLPTCVLVDDPDVRDTFTLFFTELWDKSSESA